MLFVWALLASHLPFARTALNREAFITPPALLPRQADGCAATATPCPDGLGCCPSGTPIYVLYYHWHAGLINHKDIHVTTLHKFQYAINPAALSQSTVPKVVVATPVAHVSTRTVDCAVRHQA
jgi:hypothetical protein